MKALLVLGALLAATALAAQGAADPRVQLAAAQSQAHAARARSLGFEARARAAADGAERARAAQAAVAARIQADEAAVNAAEAQLAILGAAQRAQERRLAAKEQPIVKLVAALQTMARRPAAAALVQPGSLPDLVHMQALIAAMTPQIAARTAALRGEVAHARQLRAQAAAALTRLREGERRGRSEQQRLAQLELQQRRSAAAFAGGARLEAERAAALGESTRSLEELVRRLGVEGSLRDRLASLPGPLPRPAQLTEALPADGAMPDSGRLDYRLPVIGAIVRGFGEALPSGARSRGVEIAARPGSIVVSPAQGYVTFAGLYRGYGAIAIVDHGGGYTSLVTGLGSNLARVGDRVEAGSPLGRASATGVMVELRKAGQPVDLTTFIS